MGVEDKALVLRAIRAAAVAAQFVGPVGAGGTELATVVVGKAKAVVDHAGATDADTRLLAEVALRDMKAARLTFAMWAGPNRTTETPTNPTFPMPPPTGVPSSDDAICAVLASTSSAGCFAKGDLPEARRLAANALRFATAASGGETDWTIEEV